MLPTIKHKKPRASSLVRPFQPRSSKTLSLEPRKVLRHIAMARAELVFIPFPSMGHIVSMVEMAKLLVGRDPRLSVTILLMKLSFHSDVDSYTNSLAASVTTPGIRSVHLPGETQICGNFLTHFVESNKPHVKRAVAELAGSTERLAGLVLDMFCTTLIDLADEFGIPSYVFFTSRPRSSG